MKRIISTWLLVATLLFAFSSSLLSEETPYVPPPSSGSGGDDTGDGHPWGGDDNSIGIPGGGNGITIQPIIITGMPGIDFVFYMLKREWILSRQYNQTVTDNPAGNNHTVFQSQNQPVIVSKPDRHIIVRNNRAPRR